MERIDNDLISTEFSLEIHYRLSLARQLGIYEKQIPDLRKKMMEYMQLTDEQVSLYFLGCINFSISDVAKIESVIQKPLFLTPFQIENQLKTSGQHFDIDEYCRDLYEYLEINKH